MSNIIIRHRVHDETAPRPNFSARTFRFLSSGALNGRAAPEGFADVEIPVMGATLAETIYLSGLFTPPSLCSGIGKCGHCRMRFLSEPPPPLDVEKDILSHHDLEAGWRLACRHAPEDGMHVLAPALPAGSATAGTPARLHYRRVSLAVDLGTTSIHWQAVDMKRPEDDSMPHAVMINPQMGAGSDVVSRLAYAATPEGAAVLRRLTVEALARVINSLAATGLETGNLCIAANPAMTAILLGLDTAGLSRAPYHLDFTGGEASVPGLPPLYIAPLVSPYVGGDVSAGYAALALDPARPGPNFPFFLVDLGTSGECVLAVSKDEAFAASLPMGPALEGINLRHGMTMEPGAVMEYSLTPYGLEPKVMGNTAPEGITATGYLTLLRALRAANVMTVEGTFAAKENSLPLAKRIRGHDTAPHKDPWTEEPRIRLPGKMFLTATDVEEILKVKAAFSLAISRLLREAGLAAKDLRHVFLSGALGTGTPVASLTALGFLPEAVAPKVSAAGNTSLQGALLLLKRQAVRRECAIWSKKTITLDLTDDPSFGEAYARHMAFSWIP